MDKLDSAREIIVEAIATLENAIESLMPAQAPRSTDVDISVGAQKLRSVARALFEHADRVEQALNDAENDS